MKSNQEVLESHLQLRSAGETERDIRENYADDVVIIDRHRQYQGHDGVRESAQILKDTLGNASFSYLQHVISGRLGYLVWEATISDRSFIGVDSFLIEDGKIKGQTIYYSP